MGEIVFNGIQIILRQNLLLLLSKLSSLRRYQYICVCECVYICIYIYIASSCHISNLTKLNPIVMVLTVTIASTKRTFSYMKLRKIGSVLELGGTLLDFYYQGNEGCNCEGVFWSIHSLSSHKSKKA